MRISHFIAALIFLLLPSCKTEAPAGWGRGENFGTYPKLPTAGQQLGDGVAFMGLGTTLYALQNDPRYSGGVRLQITYSRKQPALKTLTPFSPDGSKLGTIELAAKHFLTPFKIETTFFTALTLRPEVFLVLDDDRLANPDESFIEDSCFTNPDESGEPLPRLQVGITTTELQLDQKRMMGFSVIASVHQGVPEVLEIPFSQALKSLVGGVATYTLRNNVDSTRPFSVTMVPDEGDGGFCELSGSLQIGERVVDFEGTHLLRRYLPEQL